ncbi:MULTISPECIES: cell division protein FtsX [Gracilimonas]|uniref:Cell division protein FtsX n=1 Tax=Gracilimonas sediminicola TaxID=2952158 RepID=A0A9X2L0N8_9BACT|nr:permease-like cell division protein FtsX [Gracilimonas sediminicola]MCP9290104.1 permease-like cell division protein FtsX [Gracilimonas sediminicola]
MSLKYIVKEGFTGIKRAKLAATTSILSLFIAVLLLGVLTRIGFNIYSQAMSIKDLIEVEVFLFDVDERTTNQIRQELEQEELVQEVTYISKDSASAIMRKEFGAGVEELAELNFLPASFRLSVDTDAGADKIETMVSQLRNLRGVDEIEYNAALLRVMESNLNTFTFIGGGIALLILLAALILVYNTIRLTIYAKRDLIRAMKLVGATNKFIRSPFIVEGILQGLIAGGLAVICVFFIFEFAIPFYLADLGTLSWPYGRWYFLVGAMLILSLIMGWWGSRWAARRFIQETYISG